MAAKSSIVPDIIWNWVIEALATSEQADASTLIGLVKTAPAISGELGKDAKEVVSLRILETLFLQGDKADSGQYAKISFNSSERCQDVLQQILHETTKDADILKKEKWNVRPFLTHKRSSLPKCFLKKLKEAILENSNPLFASLKEKSNLVTPNSSENVNPVNNDNFDVQDTVSKDDSASLNQTKDKTTFQEKSDGEPIIKEKNLMEDEGVSNIDGDQTDSLMNICVKCNEGGELLVCSFAACPLQVHENCLGFDVTLDENGNFLCPFCVYSDAMSKYREAKRKALEARNDLQSFSSFTPKEESVKKQSEYSETCEKNVANQSMTGGEHVQNSAPQPSTPKRKSKEKESQQKSVDSTCSRELRKRKARYTPQRVPLLRRKTITWTKSEEEILKEGVERYSSGNEKGIPWKEILEFGHNVFHKGRTAIDLKDKWRNICKGK